MFAFGFSCFYIFAVFYSDVIIRFSLFYFTFASDIFVCFECLHSVYYPIRPMFFGFSVGFLFGFSMFSFGFVLGFPIVDSAWHIECFHSVFLFIRAILT